MLVIPTYVKPYFRHVMRAAVKARLFDDGEHNDNLWAQLRYLHNYSDHEHDDTQQVRTRVILGPDSTIDHCNYSFGVVWQQGRLIPDFEEANLRCHVPRCANERMAYRYVGLRDDDHNAHTAGLQNLFGHGSFYFNTGKVVAFCCGLHYSGQDGYAESGVDPFTSMRRVTPWKPARNWRFWFNGGLIFHGAGDSGVGAPTFSVRLGNCSRAGWSVNS